MPIPGLLAPIQHMMQTTGQGFAENTVHGAGHFASEDVATLSNRNASNENHGFFHTVGSVLKEMGHILRRSIGLRTPEEMMALKIASFENEASHALDFVKKADMKDASEEAVKAFGHENSKRLIDFSLPGMNDIFFNALEKKFSSLNSISAKQKFIANLEKVIPHIKLDKPESFANDDVKALFKQREACAHQFRGELVEFCRMNMSGTGLHNKLNEWIDHYAIIQTLDKINHPLITELQAHNTMRLTEEEKKALDLSKKEKPKQYDLKLVQMLKAKLEQSTMDASEKAKYKEALKDAESVYEKLNGSKFSFSAKDLKDLKPYLTDDNARTHVSGIILKRIQKESATQAPTQQLVEVHYKSFETFLKRYQNDFENHADSELKLSSSEKESLKRLLKNFDTSKPLGTETLSQIMAGLGMEPETSKNIAASLAQYGQGYAKGWAVNSILGSIIRPILGNRGTSIVTSTALSSWNGARPGQALRVVGTEMLFDHHANKVLKDMHPWVTMGWNFFGRSKVVGALHNQISKLKFITTIEDSISASLSRFWKGLKTW